MFYFHINLNGQFSSINAPIAPNKALKHEEANVIKNS